MQSGPVPAIEVVDLSRRFGGVTALDRVSLGVAQGEFFSLLGPSGCGKTTLLRIIAGLDAPDVGSLRLAGRDALNTPAHRRAVNMVFQSYALFPHMTVFDNVAFGLRMKKLPAPEIQTRVSAVMELVRISSLASRRPSQISGGEKQRVALARALVNEPEVLLLDEPLGALDLKLRKELQQELRTLQRRTGITFLYVTHDQDEALSMSDRIAVLNKGRIVQLGRSEELYERPRTRFVATFLGGCNLLSAKVRERNGTALTAETPVGDLQLTTGDHRNEFNMAIRPEKILTAPKDINAPNCFTGTVIEATYTGAETHSIVHVGNHPLRVVSVNVAAARRMVSGETIRLRLPPEALVVLED
jgi:spermidine/putrescine transport system ATP-binding protein